MPSSIVAQQTIHVGEKTVIECPSPNPRYEVLFEDNGVTGCFYALDTSRKAKPVCDTFLIYNVENVTGRDKPSLVQIVWSDDGLKAALVINRTPHAVFDFAAHRGYCRLNHPAPDPLWTKFGHEWDDRTIDLFR